MFSKVVRILESRSEGYDVVYKRWEAQKGSIHGGIVILASDTLRAIDREDAKTLKTKLTELKNFRVESDYYDVEVTKANIEKVKELLSRINQILKRHFRC